MKNYPIVNLSATGSSITLNNQLANRMALDYVKIKADNCMNGAFGDRSAYVRINSMN